jgi:small subunit ribosomal protein S14
MAKKNMVEREKKRERLINKYGKKRKEIKESLEKLPNNSAPCRHRNRCWLTGRSRGYYRDFGLSRHVLREMSHACLLPGVTKSSW